ncbi:MAG: sensor histidine kinase [Peptostreptococcaceae bacterium]
MIKLYEKYIKRKMFNKMLLIYSGITIIAIFLLANIFITYYIDNQLNNELNIHSEVILNIEKRFEDQNNISNSIANGINTQPKITDEISVLTTSTFEEYLSYKLDNLNTSNAKQLDLKYLINTILSNRNDVLAVVVNDKDKQYKTEVVLNYDKWYNIKHKQENNKNVRRITKTIKNIDSIDTIGYIDIYFDLDNLNKIIDNSNLKGSLVIIDRDNKVIFDSDNLLSDKDISNIESDSLKSISKFNKNNMIVKLDERSGLKYFSFILKDELNTVGIRNKVISISLLCIFIIIVVTYAVIRIYSLKINHMMNTIGKIKDGDLNARFNIENENDELDMIAIEIDKMSENLQESINKNYIADVKQKQAELNALQAQIKPHFLYNTLEVIRMCALASKNIDVAQMIFNLASMFRYSTYNNGSSVSLKDEIKNGKMYLDLCSARYKGMIEYKIEIDDKFLDYLIPKFTLQPILENCINHGIRKDSSNNIIVVSLVEKEDILELVVKDNGTGMNEEVLNKIEINLEKNLQKNNSIGLMNINNRLKLKFGQEYGVKVESVENYGTTVKVILPILGDDADV